MSVLRTRNDDTEGIVSRAARRYDREPLTVYHLSCSMGLLGCIFPTVKETRLGLLAFERRFDGPGFLGRRIGKRSSAGCYAALIRVG